MPPEKLLQSGLTVRGDSVYCPLAFSLDSYWNCLTDCHHCYLRHLNHTWGTDLRPLDVEKFRRDLINGLKNKNPKTPVANCISKKKTIRWGNKSDPFQHAELEYKIAPQVFRTLIRMDWSFVIQTMHTDNMMQYSDYIYQADSLATVMPIISPGGEKDREVLERGRTNPIAERMDHLKTLIKKGINCGVNGEPFIPGYHTVEEFEDIIKWLKSAGVKSYNTYNLHLNPFVAKRLHAIGLDIEKIWRMNKDENWKPILSKLLDISRKHNFVLGCPDFVNTGKDWVESANTCCGVSVPNPCTYNSHFWKQRIQNGESPERVLLDTWDGTGDKQQGEDIVYGKKSKFYTLKDAGVLK